MNPTDAVQLFLVVWIFTVCQADDDGCRLSCDDVTGSVRKEVTLTCRVSQKCTECCIKMHKFQYPERVNDSEICKQGLPERSCDQRNIFTCSYTPATEITGQFRFFLQTACGVKKIGLHVNITESIEPEIFTNAIDPEKKEEHAWHAETSEPKKGLGFKIAIITAVLSSLIIITVLVIYRITQKHPKRMKACLIFRPDGDHCNHVENGI